MRQNKRCVILREAERKVLEALLRNPKASDRYIARLVALSQPTVTRVRNLLEKKLVIRYEVIPSLAMFGFDFIAFTVMDLDERVRDDPRVIYAMGGATKMFVMSVHKDYEDYAIFERNNVVKRDNVIHSKLLVPTSFTSVKALSFKDVPLGHDH